MDTLWKFILFLAFGPAIIAVLMQVWFAALAALLPWIIGLVVLGAAVAGLVAGLVLRRGVGGGQSYFPPPRTGFPSDPIRRPREPRSRRS